MKFKKKPVEIEAEQFWPEERPWPEGVELHPDLPAGQQYRISTLEGLMIVSPGDWVITGVQGERYPCKPDIFKQTYERSE